MLGIIKAILMVKYGTILPTAGFEKFNSRIEGQEKLVVASEAIPWPKGEPRRALVTNFGMELSSRLLPYSQQTRWVPGQ